MKRKKTAGILLAAAAAAMLGGCIPQADSQTAAETAQEGETAAEVTVNKEGLPIVDTPITYEIAASTQKNKNFK